MSLSRITACKVAITFFLAMLITQLTLAGDHVNYAKLSTGKWRLIDHTWPAVSNADKPNYLNNTGSPKWVFTCDSLNRILYAPLNNQDCDYRWLPAYIAWLDQADSLSVARFTANYFLDNNPVYPFRDASITVYQAMESITFEAGFETADGDQFETLLLGSVATTPPPVNPGPDNRDMNWIVARSFDENGNVLSESKDFYDKNGRALQTQTKMLYRDPASVTSTQVFASQSIRDAYGRDAAKTMAAPINNSEFSYNPGFVRGPDGSVYTYRNFDRYIAGNGTETDKTNNPDAIGGKDIPGTLGWYYSKNNTLEPYTPTTSYPYARGTYYQDGTGRAKKEGGAGEAFTMGSGHEKSNYSVPVINELSHYLQVRNKFFSAAEVGNLPGSIQNDALLAISTDVNGKEVVRVTDKTGKVLFSCRSGNDLPVTNTITIKALPHVFTFPPLPSGSGCTLPGHVVRFSGSGSIIKLISPVYGPLTLTGPLDNYGVYFSGSDFQSVIKSDAPFTVTYQDRQGNTCDAVTITGNSTNTLTNNIVPFHYFKILADNSDVTITGDYTLVDMNTEKATSLLPGNKLNRGYYKLYANSVDADVTLTYTNKFTDVSYNFYNQLGQIIASISPEGVKKLYGTGLNNYATKSDIPFTAFNEYDVQGRLIKTTSTDGGSTELIYRKDGKIRFSQNSEQKGSGRFSYTNVDNLGRVIEAGEYQPDANGIQFNSDLVAAVNPMRDILENTGNTGGLTSGTKTNVVMTIYDVPDETHGLKTAGYVQDATILGSTITMTKKYSTILNNTPLAQDLISSTWYNYDIEGKTLWTIENINGLGLKTTDYSYDALGRLVKKIFQKIDPTETFVHYYEYDPFTKKLWRVYTNTQDNVATRQLQATYIYYLHGALKRIELAGDLQGIDYTYTLDGSLKAINNSNKAKDPGGDGSNGFSSDAFGMVLDYFPGDYQNDRPLNTIQEIKGVNTAGIATDSYAGDIKAMTWFSRKPTSVSSINPGIEDPTTYIYQYDDNYQFTESTWGTGIDFSRTPAGFNTTNLYKETVKKPSDNTSAYDANGNMLYLQRTNETGALEDGFTYNYLNTITGTGSSTDYNTNRLESVTSNATGTPQIHANYTYNKVGQLVNEATGNSNTQKYIKYDATGKVVMVARDPGFSNKVVEYVYNETGQRIIKKSYNAGVPSQVTYYVENAIYTQVYNNGTPGAIVPQEYRIDGEGVRFGTYYKQSNICAYELKDHLGSVRAVVAKNNGTMEVRMYTDYYPYGMVIRNRTYQSPDGNRYEFQGAYAEKDPETDWNAFELRMYDSKIAKWLSVDPYGQHASPYLSMGNNPVSGVDKDGGFYEELRNLITHKMWISDEGWARYSELKENSNPEYKWVGSRLKGHAVISYNDTYLFEPFHAQYEIYYTRVNQEFEATRDFLFTGPTGQIFAVYPDLELKSTVGARVSLSLGFVDLDVNPFSMELGKYSFAEGSRSIADVYTGKKGDAWDFGKLRFEQGISGSAKIGKVGVKAGFKVEYDMAMKTLDESFNAKLGNFDVKGVYKAMKNEMSLTMSWANKSDFAKNFKMDDTEKAWSCIIGVEAKFLVKSVAIPNNDVEAYMHN